MGGGERREEGDGEIDQRASKERKRERRETAAEMERQRKIKERRDRDRGVETARRVGMEKARQEKPVIS